jgi:hypothetical protein
MLIKNIILLALVASACAGKTSHQQQPTGSAPTNGAPQEQQPPANAAEGTITSSGGYLYRYENNPWYLQNTPIVKYCVAMDEVNFGVPKAVAQKEISLAIETWKAQLAMASYTRYGSDLKPWSEIRLGTQDFEEVSCDSDSVNLRFQLGQLSDAQQAILGNPKRYVADTFQTSYDEVNMRGSGFIYLAPEKGPFMPDESGKAEHFWSEVDGIALHVVLLHELGHIFGFPHTPDTIMDDDLPQNFIREKLLNRMREMPDFNRSYILKSLFPSLIGYTQDPFAIISKEYSSHFRRGQNDTELAVKCDNSQITNCDVYEYADGKFGTKVGSLEYNEQRLGTIEGDIRIKIPAAQKVFELSDELRNDFTGITMLSTIQMATSEVAGSYKSIDGSMSFPMSVRSEAHVRDKLICTVVIDGKIKVFGF